MEHINCNMAYGVWNLKDMEQNDTVVKKYHGDISWNHGDAWISWRYVRY
jgi:hypothetical protein